MNNKLATVRNLISESRWTDAILSLIDLLPEEETEYYAGTESTADTIRELQVFLDSVGQPNRSKLNSATNTMERNVTADAWGIYAGIYMIDINDIALFVSLMGATPRSVLIEPVINSSGELHGWVLSYAGTVIFGSLENPLSFKIAVDIAKAACKPPLGWIINARRHKDE